MPNAKGILRTSSNLGFTRLLLYVIIIRTSAPKC
jgi:hypothetical protein